MQETWVWSLDWDNPLEKEMATDSSIPAWRIPWTEESGGLQCMSVQRVGDDWAHRSLSKPEPMTCTRQSPASRPPPTFCSICSQSATTQVLYTWDFLRGSILHVPITHTHTENANYVRSYTHYLPWLWRSFHNVYFYQNIKVYTLNTYNFYLSVTSQ